MTSRKHKPSPKLMYQDPAFMESPSARPMRMMAEYFDPLTRLRREHIGDTIVMFGSARILPHDRAVAKLKRLQSNKSRKNDPMHGAEVRAAKANLEMSRYYEEARELARRITAWSLTLGEHPRRFVICSGGGPGIMEAANRGASEAGGSSIGLSIQLPHEQESNRYITPELNLFFHYFFMRKLWFAQLAKALIAFPGGFGTMDELWEMLTLLQTRKLPEHHLILIYGRKYWDKVLDWRAMVRAGTISEREFSMLQFADTVDEAFVRIRTGLEKYHLVLDSDWEGV